MPKTTTWETIQTVINTLSLGTAESITSIIPPLHEEEMKDETKEWQTTKIKFNNIFLYKTIIDKNIIYEGVIKKSKINEMPFLLTLIYLESGQIFEKIVYINDKEIDKNIKVVEQFKIYHNTVELSQETNIIKNENDNNVFINRRSIKDFTKIDTTTDDNNENVESKFKIWLKKCLKGISKIGIFICETYVYGMIGAIVHAFATITATTTIWSLTTSIIAWWTPLATGLSVLIGATTLPFWTYVVMAVLIMALITVIKDYVISPLFKKIKKLTSFNNLPEPMTVNDLVEINLRNINVRILKNYLKKQKIKVLKTIIQEFKNFSLKNKNIKIAIEKSQSSSSFNANNTNTIETKMNNNFVLKWHCNAM